MPIDMLSRIFWLTTCMMGEETAYVLPDGKYQVRIGLRGETVSDNFQLLLTHDRDEKDLLRMKLEKDKTKK